MLSLVARHGRHVAAGTTTLLFPSRGAKSVGRRCCENASFLLYRTPAVASSIRPACSALFLSTSSRADETAPYDDDGSKQPLLTAIQDLEMNKESNLKHANNHQYGETTETELEPPVRHPRYHATPQMSHFGSLYHPLKAFHIARTIDLVQVKNMLNDSLLGAVADGGGDDSLIKKKFFGKNSLVIQLSSPRTMIPHNSKNSSNNKDTNNSTQLVHMPEVTRYMAVFRFGSVVFLNVSPRQVANLVQEIKTKYSTEPVASGHEKRENFGVMVSPAAMLAQQMRGGSGQVAARRQQQQQQQQQRQPSLRPQQPQQPQQLGRGPAKGVPNGKATNATTLHQQPQQNNFEQQQQPLSTAQAEEPDVVVKGDYCIVPDLDLNGVAVISNILAQTVAMDSYNEKVDEMLNQFEVINSTVIHTGSLPNTEKTFLFKTVAKNNAIFIDMIRKIRLKDRSETAWTITKHESIHYELKAEFEIDDRFDQIDFKLNLIQQNAKFFLEVLQSQKSNSLEWCIVILIMLECCIMSIDMSGMGPGLYEYVSSWMSWPTTSTTTVTLTPTIPPATTPTPPAV